MKYALTFFFFFYDFKVSKDGPDVLEEEGEKTLDILPDWTG